MRVNPEDLPVCEASIKGVIRNKQNHWQGEYRMTNGDAASHRWVHSQGRIFYDDRGEPVRMIGVNMDITESKRVEEAMCERAKRGCVSLRTLCRKLSTPAALTAWRITPIDSGMSTLAYRPKNRLDTPGRTQFIRTIRNPCCAIGRTL